MADRAPNLEDGELWLPSDIFLNQVSSEDIHQNFSSMDKLPLSCLPSNRNNNSKSLRNFPPTPKCIPFASHGVVHIPPYNVNFGGGLPHPNPGGYGNRSGLCEQNLFHQYGLGIPMHPQPQVNSFMDNRAWILQMATPNRPLPLHPNGFGRGLVGGMARGKCGTGVFLPQVMNHAGRSNHYATKSKKKNDMAQATQQIQGLRNASIGNQEERHPNLSPDMRLPEEWTY